LKRRKILPKYTGTGYAVRRFLVRETPSLDFKGLKRAKMKKKRSKKPDN
jgi:hypothetical protein